MLLVTTGKSGLIFGHIPYVAEGVMKILINNSHLVKNESGIHIRVCLDVENLH